LGNKSKTPLARMVFIVAKPVVIIMLMSQSG